MYEDKTLNSVCDVMWESDRCVETERESVSEDCTFSRSARSMLPPNSFRSRSTLLKLDEYFGNVGGGTGRAAIAGFSCCLFTLWMPAVGAVVLLVKLPMYAPGDDNTGFADRIGGGPLVGVLDSCDACWATPPEACWLWITGALIFTSQFEQNALENCCCRWVRLITFYFHCLLSALVHFIDCQCLSIVFQV